MRIKGNLAPAWKMRRLNLGPTWRFALLAGFVVQLLLILFVTSIGLGQLGVSKDSINNIVDVHMRKQSLTKTMVTSARERTVNLFKLVESDDPFERDELHMHFIQNAVDFINARAELLSLPLSSRERELLEKQGKFTGIGVPIQNRVVEMVNAGSSEAEALLISEVIPAQNMVLDALSQLDAETQKIALEASRRAVAAHDVAKFWMITLSGIALSLGLVVAAAVIHYTNRANREREHLASHDALTGLPNRMLFMDRLEQALVRAQRHGTLLGVLFIDLDRFKRVNDTLGHASGDMLICELAVRLRNALRAEDIVARLGGDEFVVVITEAGKISHILQAVENLIGILAEPYRIDGRELFSSCSIGVSLYPHDGDNSNVLLKHADTAMYHAKNGGRNRFQLYDRAMNAMAEERLQLETDLHYAIERGEFVLHYQPQLNLETGRIQAVEALLRWNHPQKGLLSPASFLELLEETGGIVSVGPKLLIEACCQAANWNATGYSGMSVAVNISGREFWHESLIHNVRAALKISGLPPHLLQLELTEGIFMQDIDNAVNKIMALKVLGITVAVDDFGTGYSSLAHLKRFPIDCLKIDRYFVKDLQDALINEAFIGSILALCQGLHLDSVAEGVEDVQQLERLRKLGCQLVQGYLISRPVPAEEVAGLLTRDWLDEFGRKPENHDLAFS
jgi:diguanylate cyclase (GGDEF)-like protein